MDDNIVYFLFFILFMYIYYLNHKINNIEKTKEKFSNTCADASGNISLPGDLNAAGSIRTSGGFVSNSFSLLQDPNGNVLQLNCGSGGNTNNWLINNYVTAAPKRLLFQYGDPTLGWGGMFSIDSSGNMVVRGNIKLGGTVTPNQGSTISV